MDGILNHLIDDARWYVMAPFSLEFQSFFCMCQFYAINSQPLRSNTEIACRSAFEKTLFIIGAVDVQETKKRIERKVQHAI